MKRVSELNLQPGETVTVDSITDGVARLLIGRDGERVETVAAADLPEEGREAGAALRIGPGGAWTRDHAAENAAARRVGALMDDVFGGPPPE